MINDQTNSQIYSYFIRNFNYASALPTSSGMLDSMDDFNATYLFTLSGVIR